ncbi:MAG: YgiQ family radical SAM protein [Desulfuromonadaceae bacterium]|nr:YgiQ family radical SAM protein [Desulfuromonadaceae bacterium]MDD2849270.1 YgiQ family radical SAM protein [Desulfuromonadaceae bacterium]MDD4131897.1 YgiQ family radical SAM protein [Desulfuromonadaceae bacterium]
MSFIPTTQEEMRRLGWQELDIILVSGDAYIDHPAFGVPLLARWLEGHGFRVGIIAQPDWRSKESFMTLGRPRLFFGVSAGAMDSMVAHYTPARKLRHDDAYTPGNRHGARPNRATMVYTSRLKEAFKDVPVVIGGIEASLRRFAHYDFWENKVRRSILFDAKADLLVYGMGERAILEVAERLRDGVPMKELRDVRGTAYGCSGFDSGDYVSIPSFEEVSASKETFAEAFRTTYLQQNPWSARVVVQQHGNRALVCNPPALPLTEAEMDAVYSLPFEKSPHPAYAEAIPAWEQIKTSVTSHRGCFGGCAFCAITMHQGKTIQSRSKSSIIAEITAMTRKSWFRGTVSDIGGPTANMYGLGCRNVEAMKKCQRESCIFPDICSNLKTADAPATSLLQAVRSLDGVRHTAVSSGVRYDLLERQPAYFSELTGHHVSGLLKIAPEHLVDRVTDIMRKPGKKAFETFLTRFRAESDRLGKRQFIVPYLISGHPGCTLADMLDLALILKKLGMKVEQVQDFTPTPGTIATCMFYSGIDPMTGKRVYSATSDREKGLQKSLLLWHLPAERAKVLEALKELGREGDYGLLCGGAAGDERSPGVHHKKAVTKKAR